MIPLCKKELYRREWSRGSHRKSCWLAQRQIVVAARLRRIWRVERLQIPHCPEKTAFSISLPLPHVREILEKSLWIASPRLARGTTQMYHCLDEQRLQTVPAEKHFVQIDNSIARDSAAHKFPPQKPNPFPRKKFRHIPDSAFLFRIATTNPVPHFRFTSSLNILN